MSKDQHLEESRLQAASSPAGAHHQSFFEDAYADLKVTVKKVEIAIEEGPLGSKHHPVFTSAFDRLTAYENSQNAFISEMMFSPVPSCVSNKAGKHW